MVRLLTILACIALLLGLAEGTAQLLETIRPEVESVSFDYAPYRMLRMTSAPFPLNRDGFRAAELDTYRGAFLVEFLGGSVCLGVGTNPGKPLTEQLEEALHRVGMTKAKVVNLCQGGAASAQELAIFLQYGLPMRPQVVLSFNGANDLLHPRPLGEDDHPNLPYRNREMQSLFEGHHSWPEHLALKRIGDRLGRRLSLAITVPGIPAPVPSSSILESYFYVTEVIRALAEGQGGAYGLILQPALHYAKPLSSQEQLQWAERRPRDAGVAAEYARGLFLQARASAAEWSGRSGARLFDLTETFAQTPETVYSDSVHFTGATGFRMLEQELERQGIVAWIEQRYRAWEEQPPAKQVENGGLAWRR
jgi:hypothetical protein